MTRTEADLREHYATLADAVTEGGERRARELIGRLSLAEPRRRPRRRRTVVALASVVALGGGLATAAAAGVPVVPSAVSRALGWDDPVPGAYNARPDTAQRVLTTTLPDGRAMDLWFAKASHGGYCVAALLARSPGHRPSADDLSGGSATDGQDEAGGGCGGPIGSRWWRTFGAERVSAGNAAGDTFIVHVPGARRVQLAFPDGSRQDLPLADDWTAGWLPAARVRRHPMLIGYDAAGHEIGRIRPF